MGSLAGLGCSNNINMETIAFLSMVQDLMRDCAGGFMPFSKYNGSMQNSAADRRDYILYDDRSYEPENGYPVICDCCCACDHHDIISTYDDAFFDGITVRAVAFEEGDEPDFVMVSVIGSPYEVAIFDNRWEVDFVG